MGMNATIGPPLVPLAPGVITGTDAGVVAGTPGRCCPRMSREKFVSADEPAMNGVWWFRLPYYVLRP
jgi:hypothetical protein